MSGVEILGVLSAVITVIEGTCKILNAIKSEKDTPRVFADMAKKLPLLLDSLTEIKEWANAEGNKVAWSLVGPLVEQSQKQAQKLKEVVVICEDKGPPPRKERYCNYLRKDRRKPAEEFMQQLTENITLLHQYKVSRSAEDLKAAMNEMGRQVHKLTVQREESLAERNDVDQQVPMNRDVQGGVNQQYGSGRQFNNTGNNNGTGQMYQGSIQNFGDAHHGFPVTQSAGTIYNYYDARDVRRSHSQLLEPQTEERKHTVPGGGSSPSGEDVGIAGIDARDWAPSTAVEAGRQRLDLFSSLGSAKEQILGESKYWRRLTYKSYKVYWEIYNSCITRGSRRDGYVDFLDYRLHIPTEDFDDERLADMWIRLVGSQRPAAEIVMHDRRPVAKTIPHNRPFVLVITYMLHVEKFSPSLLPEFDGQESWRLENRQLEWLKIADRWVQCRCDHKCVRQWNFMNPGGMSIIEKREEIACKFRNALVSKKSEREPYEHVGKELVAMRIVWRSGNFR